MTEQDIQTSIKNQLKRNGWLVTKLIQTSTNGIPDLLALKNGVAVFVEVKMPGNQPDPLQTLRIGQLRKQNFEVIIATSKTDVEHLK